MELRLPVLGRLLPLLFLALALTPGGLAQDREPTAKAVLSTRLVKLGGVAELRLEVTNAKVQPRLLTLPEVDGIEVSPPSRPVVNRFTSRINGRLYSHSVVAWELRLRPLRAGEFTLPQLEVEVDGKVLQVPDRPLELKVVEDIVGAEVGFLEIVDVPERVFEGQPFTLDLRFGWADDLSLHSAGLYLPWWSRLPGTLDVAQPPPPAGTVRKEIPVNRARKELIDQLPPETRGQHLFQVYRLTRRLIASRPGTLPFPQSTFEFSELVARGRGVQRDTYRDFYANLAGFEIEVVPVPEEDRPYEWTGAVGQLSADRRVDLRDVDAGDSIKLEVTWTGDANVEFFDEPDLSRLEAFEGFKQLGKVAEFDATTRRVVYDLVPLSDSVTEVPPVPLWTFDPEGERYVKVETLPVPIRVRAVEGFELPAERGEAAEVFDIRDVHTEPRSLEAVSGPSGRLLLGTLLGLPLLWLGLRTAVRRRGDPASPAQRRRRRAPRLLARELGRARSASHQARALAAYLGARTSEPDWAWLGRDPLAWAEGQREAAPSPEALAELAALQAELDEATWARDDRPLEPGRLRGVAARLAKEGL